MSNCLLATITEQLLFEGYDKLNMTVANSIPMQTPVDDFITEQDSSASYHDLTG